MRSIMKYFFALAFLLLAGCSVDPYAPGGEYYIAPGTFKGLWVITAFTPNVPSGMISDTNTCTALITECDANLKGTIINDSTKEELQFSGFHSNYDNATHYYGVFNDTDNQGYIYRSSDFYFSSDGSSFEYYGQREINPDSSVEFDILCYRQ
jgi:hypothetical protein